MDIQDKTKEQLIAELQNLQEQNHKLKSQLDGITIYESTPEKGNVLNGVTYVCSVNRDISKINRTEELLLNSEIKNKFAILNSIFESSQNIIIFSLDTNYCYTAFTNLHKKTMKLIWGVDIAIGMNMLELIKLPADRKKAKDNFDKVLSGEYLRFEEEYGDVNLFRTYYEDTYNPIIDNNGNVVGLSVFVVDITERKQAEQALKESEEKYRLITEFKADVVWVFNITTGKFTYISPSVYQLRGFTVEEAMNQTLEDSITHNSIDIVKDTIATQKSNFIEQPEAHNYYINEIQQYCKNGDIIWVEISSQYRYNPSGEIEVVGVSRNIEKRKKAEQELKESEEKYKESQLIGNVAHWEYNFITKELFWSDQLYKIYELSKDDFEPDLEKALNASHIDDQETIRKTYFDAIQNKLDFVLESRIKAPNGDIKHVITKAKPKFDENGNLTTIIGTVVDITERKKIENELKKSQEELRNFSTYLLKIRENERAEITLEIHDSIAQFLVALKVEMGLYLKKMSSGIDVVKTEDVKTKMEQLVSKVDITLKSARMIMNGLRPEQLELLGLVEATEVHLHNFEEIHHIKCYFENSVTEPITHQELSIVLFRILQESLTNILKHANANAVTVKLTKLESNLMLEVIDNGVGFDEKCMFKPDSYGVISMREQVKRLNGIFSIKSQLGQGTLVRVEIPYNELKKIRL